MITIMVIALLSYLLAVKKLKTNYYPSIEEGSTSIQKSSDLDEVTDQLDSINVDAVDTGLNELKTEVSTY